MLCRSSEKLGFKLYFVRVLDLSAFHGPLMPMYSEIGMRIKHHTDLGVCHAKSDWITGLTPPKAINSWFFSHGSSFLDDVFEREMRSTNKITELQHKD